MIEVTRENFDSLYPEIIDILKKSDFIGNKILNAIYLKYLNDYSN